MKDDQRQPGEQTADELPGDRPEPTDVAEQDFAARNVVMSNALQGGSSPVAGALVGSGGELGMQPATDETLAPDEDDLPAHEKREPHDEQPRGR